MATGPSAQDRTEAHIPPVNDTTTQQRLRDEAIPAVEPTTAPVQHSSAVPPRIDTSTRTSTEPEGRSGSPADSDARLTQTGTSHRPETGRGPHFRFNVSNTSKQHHNLCLTNKHYKVREKVSKMLASTGEP